MNEARFTPANTDGDPTQAKVLNSSFEDSRTSYCAAVLGANTSMRGVEVKHVRRKDVDLEKMWDVESATGKGVSTSGIARTRRASVRSR